MKHHGKTALVAALTLGLLAGAVQALAQSVVITDCCDWAIGWSFSSHAVGAGTATATVEGSGGNPGARLNVTTVTPTPADTAFGTAILTTSTRPAPASGTAFTLTLDVLSGTGGFGQGQAIELLVQQGGAVYAQALGITGFPLNTFTTLNFTGVFSPGGFVRVIGAGPAQPVFDGVTPTQFGFGAGNNSSATLTQYYDNFRLTIAAPASVASESIPTLSQWGLILLATMLAAFGMFRALRRRH